MQILVAVANIPVRPWKTDVEKASMGTAVGHGSVDPKGRTEDCIFQTVQFPSWARKGSGLIFPHLDAVVKARVLFPPSGGGVFCAVVDGNVSTLSETLATGPERVFSSC